MKMAPLCHNATPEEVARAILMRAPDAAPFVTGADVLVDGGLQWRCVGVRTFVRALDSE